MHGGVAQLVEHLVCNQAVVGSNPVASTNSLDDQELDRRSGIDARSRAERRLIRAAPHAGNEWKGHPIANPRVGFVIFENKVNWNCGNYDEQERG